MSRLVNVVDLPRDGIGREVAQSAIEELRGRTIVNLATGIAVRLSASAKGKLISNKATGKSKANGFTREQHNAIKESKQHGHRIYSVEAIKLEALDRIVEVVSGNTPHASSAPTRRIIAGFCSCVNAVWRLLTGGNSSGNLLMLNKRFDEHNRIAL